MSRLRLFPILNTYYRAREEQQEIRAAGGIAQVIAIPWDMLAPHEQQAQRNHGQSLERLAERGGLSACEALAVLEDRQWERVKLADSHTRLLHAVIVWTESTQTPPPTQEEQAG